MNESVQNGPAAVPAPSSTPVVARVAKITLSDYRAFPSGPPYEFNLGPEGNNLLLFGENGSGKTSLFRALRDLTALRPGPKAFADFQNIYQPSNEGFISVQLSAGSTNEFRWEYGEEHPRETEGQPYSLFTQRCRFLDYKALLETNFVHRAVAPNLFNLLIEDILRDLPVIINGKQKRLYAVYQEMINAKPIDHRGQLKIDLVDKVCENFNTALTNHLPEVVAEGNRLIKKMGYENFEFNLNPEKVIYDRVKRDFVGRTIRLSATLFGKPIEQPQIFLNEARLTALALALYFGAAKLVLKMPLAGADGTIMVRLMVLDDVLIGLDLANRLPILKILDEEFGEWQIILMTYDQTWYDLAKEYTEHMNCWTTLKLRELQTGPGQPCRPHIESCLNLVEIAEKHFLAGDLMATAVYIRAAFETRLKNVCEKNGIKISYKREPKDVKADQLWQGIEGRQKEWKSNKKKDFINQKLMRNVKTVRSIILNRLSHSGAPMLVASEVKFALDTVKQLQQHQFAKE